MSKEEAIKKLNEDKDYHKLRLENFIKLPECKKRRVYKIHSRNLSFGVFDGESGFIGIREKFGNRSLFREFHWDNGPPFGTVRPLEDTGIDIPEEIDLSEFADQRRTKDAETGRYVDFDIPVSQGGKGWYFIDTKESDLNIRPTVFPNKNLFDFLQQIENDYTSHI